MEHLNGGLIKLLNYRIEQEEFSSRLYLAMSIWLDYNGYGGAAKLWKIYSNEEMGHAQWTYQYLLDLDVMPVVPSIKQPTLEFNGLPDVVLLSKQHEDEVTIQCQQLAGEALKSADFMTLELAQRYLKEQVDELAKTQYWIDWLNASGTEKTVLRLLDNEMAQVAG